MVKILRRHLERNGKFLIGFQFSLTNYCIHFFIHSLRFVPDKGFEGAEKSASRGDGPVAFEQDKNFDPFQIDDFLGNLKQKNSKQDDSSKEPSKKKRK